MHKVVLFCKSYLPDLYRARRLAESIDRFNVDHIPFYVCVPSQDLAAFKDELAGLQTTFLTDETILEKTCRAYGPIPGSFPPHLLQQLVKLEFWRMALCETYVWVDSDAYFIRPFKKDDFFYDENTPYTIRHNSEELRRFSQAHNPIAIQDFESMARRFQRLFGRSGPCYNFGYPPIIWSCRVLKCFNEDYIAQNHTTLFELLRQYPCEMQLYGEYLLYSKMIPVIAIEPLFRVFHYPEQFLESQMMGECEHSLSRDYLGIIIQSNWAQIKKKTTRDKLRIMIRKIRRHCRRFTP